MQNERYFRRSWILYLKTAAIILAALAIWLFWSDVAGELLMLVFCATVLAFILTPIARLLERKFSRNWATLLALIGTLALFVAALSCLLPALFEQLRTLAGQLPEAFQRLQMLYEAMVARIQRKLPGFRMPEMRLMGEQGNLKEAAQGAIATVSGAADWIYRLFLSVMLSYFLITDRERILLSIELAIPQSWRKSAVRAGSMLARELRLYLRGQATIALAVGVIAALALWCIGLSGAALLGALVGLLNAIPYFGPFLGGIPAVLTALGAGWQKAALTILTLFLVQQIDGMLISPRIMGSVTGFSPAIVMLALFAGARIGSIGGMLLAMPTLMTIRTLYRVFVQRHEKD